MSQRLATPSHVVTSALCCAMAVTAGASEQAEPKRNYNLPRGDAATTLNQFGGASDRPIVFMMDKVRGEQTNAVTGEFSPREALARMLAGTALIARQDNATGAFVVSRAARSDSADQPSAKPKPQTQAAPKPVKSKTLIALLTGWLSLSVATPGIRSADGSSSIPGVIRGQVFNPATQQYVRNAEIQIDGTNVVTYSGADGSYVLADVPPGETRVSVNYTGYESAIATVKVVAGESITRNFELVGLTYNNSGQAPQRDGGVVRLNQFIVSSEREGNAKAIMEQRASLNTKTVVASDNFGDITGGHVGEFIKYLPGVVMDTDVYGDPWGARIGGLDPKYAGVTLDGMRMASGGDASGLNDTSRQFDFNLISITGIESIEVNKTSTASMDGDSPAGAINLRSKNAFERKGREITAQLNVTGNTYALSLRKTPGPNNESKTFKVLPGLSLSYANVFGERLGVQLSLGSSSVYTTRNDLTTGFNYSLPARGPLITSLAFQRRPK